MVLSHYKLCFYVCLFFDLLVFGCSLGLLAMGNSSVFVVIQIYSGLWGLQHFQYLFFCMMKRSRGNCFGVWVLDFGSLRLLVMGLRCTFHHCCFTLVKADTNSSLLSLDYWIWLSSKFSCSDAQIRRSCAMTIDYLAFHYKTVWLPPLEQLVLCLIESLCRESAIISDFDYLMKQSRNSYPVELGIIICELN